MMRFCQLRLLAEPQHLLMAIDDGGGHGRTQRRRKYFRRRQVEAHDLRQNLDLYFEGTNRRPAARSAVGLDREESAESKIIDPRIKSDYSAKFLSSCRHCRIVITFSARLCAAVKVTIVRYFVSGHTRLFHSSARLQCH